MKCFVIEALLSKSIRDAKKLPPQHKECNGTWWTIARVEDDGMLLN